MKNRLRIEVEKNGTRLGSAGCNDRGIFSVDLELPSGEIKSHCIEVPGGRKPDQHAWWSLGSVKPGDVVTFRIVEGGPLSRPIRREVHTLEFDIAAAKKHVRFLRRQNLKRLQSLDAILRTGKYPTVAPIRRADQMALRISLGEREFCVAGAHGADRVSARVHGIFHARHPAPKFGLQARVNKSRGQLSEVLSWDMRIKKERVIRVEVLASARASPPQRRNQWRPPKSPSTRAELKAAIEQEWTEMVLIEHRHEAYLELVRQVAADRAAGLLKF